MTRLTPLLFLMTSTACGESPLRCGEGTAREGDTCVAPNKGRSRDVIVCQRLASEFGEVTAFRAANNVFDADELAKCND